MAVEHELRLPGGGGEAAERRREVVLVARGVPGEDRRRREPGRGERLVDTVARRVDRTAASPTRSTGPRARRRPPDRQPAALQVGERVGVDAVLGAEPLQVRAQPRPPRPSRRRRSWRGPASERPSRSRRAPRRARSSRARSALPAAARCPRARSRRGCRRRGRSRGRSSVDAVRTDDDVAEPGSPPMRSVAPSVRPLTFDRDAVTEDRPGCRRLLDQESVEPPPLGHQDERRVAAASKRFQ